MVSDGGEAVVLVKDRAFEISQEAREGPLCPCGDEGLSRGKD